MTGDWISQWCTDFRLKQDKTKICHIAILPFIRVSFLISTKYQCAFCAIYKNLDKEGRADKLNEKNIHNAEKQKSKIEKKS